MVFSKVFTPSTFGVDVFEYYLQTFNNWIVPPIYLLNRAFILYKTKGTLAIPKWTSAVNWPTHVNHITYEYTNYIKKSGSIEIRNHFIYKDQLKKVMKNSFNLRQYRI